MNSPCARSNRGRGRTHRGGADHVTGAIAESFGEAGQALSPALGGTHDSDAVPQEPAQNCTEKQIVDVPLSQLQEEIVEEQEPMCNDTVEQVVDVLALQVQETVEVNMAIPDGRMSESILEYIAVDPVRQTQEQSMEVVKINHTSETCAIARWSKLLTCPLHSRRRKGGSCAAPPQ